MKRSRKRKCKHCGRFYWPDPRNRYHQRCCSDQTCQRARHQANQSDWLAQPENQNYFRGSEQVKWVQAWRRSHPGYWRKKTAPLQDDIAQTIRQLHHRGETILNPKFGSETKGRKDAGKTFAMSG